MVPPPPPPPPPRSLVYTLQRKTEAQFSYTAREAGPYELCFKNDGWYPGHVVFQSHVGAHVEHEKAKVTELKSLEQRIRYLQDAVEWSIQEYEYQKGKLGNMSARAAAVNQRVVIMAVLEAVIGIGTSVGQVMFIRRLFRAGGKRVGVARA